MSSFERSRGCCFSESFRSAAEIAANGGVITGVLEYDQEKGAKFYTGSSVDGIRYQFTTDPFNSGYWSAVIEFWPAFAAAETVWRTFFYTQLVNRTYVVHSGGGDLQVFTGASVGVMTALLADYQAYWRVNQRNVLVVACRSGANAMWLNGTQIAASALAWTPQANPQSYVGFAYDGASYPFFGYLRSLKFFRHNAAAELFTQQDATDYYNRTRFSGTIARLKREGVTTLWADYRHSTQDMSGLGRDGVVTEPVVFGHNGASFQGVGRITHPDHVLGRNTTGSVVILCNVTRHGPSVHLFCARDASPGTRLDLYFTPTGLNNYQPLGESVRTGLLIGSSCIGFNYTTGTTPLSYINGVLSGVFVGLQTYTADDAPITIGNFATGTAPIGFPIACVLETSRVLTAAEHWAVYREMSEQVW